ncbi:hypothetical protein CTAYLR_000796 [Chrysophaeum taylorii]|uniref:U-box domain-containing protein n=1 Tax=Chrysophaeum taylorii TaxID=2483200 RepID=A0AAD7XS97_9STRA|nr:hypothetical protein CTAYLR_000796 [Chrysophaeum taylorii]
MASWCDIPPEFTCPITTELMRDPVMTPDGHTYERSAIINWFAMGRRSSPMTNAPLVDKTLVPNHALKRAINAFVADYQPRARATALETTELRERVRRLECELSLSRGTGQDGRTGRVPASDDVRGRLEAVEGALTSVREGMARIEAQQLAATPLMLALAKLEVPTEATERILSEHRHAFPATTLRTAGLDAGDCRRAGYPAGDCRAAGFSARQCKEAGFAPRDVFAAGFPVPASLQDAQDWPALAECRDLGVAQLRNAGYDVDTPEAAELFSAGEYRSSGTSDARALRSLGFGLVELRRAGFSPADLQTAGFEIPEYVCSQPISGRDAAGWPPFGSLRRAGFSLGECEQFGYDAIQDDARGAGYSAEDFMSSGKTAVDCRRAGFSAKDLKVAGFSGAECKAAGYTAAELLPLCTGNARKIESKLMRARSIPHDRLPLTSERTAAAPAPTATPPRRSASHATPPRSARLAERSASDARVLPTAEQVVRI